EQTFTTISYSMDRPGFVGTLHIYNIAGQIVREVCQNDVWGSAGFYTWDGTDSAGRKVRPGYYILWAQVLNLDGQMEQVKKAVVVRTKFLQKSQYCVAGFCCTSTLFMVKASP